MNVLWSGWLLVGDCWVLVGGVLNSVSGGFFCVCWFVGYLCISVLLEAWQGLFGVLWGVCDVGVPGGFF